MVYNEEQYYEEFLGTSMDSVGMAVMYACTENATYELNSQVVVLVKLIVSTFLLRA